MNHHPVENKTDQAWVTIDTSLSMQELEAFCNNIERLFRINPFLEFSAIVVTDPNHIMIQGKNLSNEQNFEFKISKQLIEHGFRLSYDKGIKRSTTITLHKTSAGNQIKILDDYSGIPEDERHQRLHEVDKSLIAWGTAIKDYLTAWQKWSKFSLWRWYKNRLWLPMKPSARRISWMLINITVLEFIAFLMVFAIFWLELDNYFSF